MKLFDNLISEIDETLAPFSERAVLSESNTPWSDVGYNQVILQRDSAYELDGVGFNLVTSSRVDDGIFVIGDDLDKIKDDRRFARIAIIQMETEDDQQKAYDLIKKIEYTKYKCFPDGYMMRSSSKTHNETVRVSKKSLKNGMRFGNIGKLLINKYKENPAVKGVKLIFITDTSADFVGFEKIAKKNIEIIEALNQVMNDLNFDCDTCNLKAVCDEVEGMREMHFKNSKNKGMS